jgi:Domain of unknown function (DUF4276)
MVEMRLYVEGGGDTKLLRTACRRGVSEFLAKAGLKGCLPRIVASGGRQQAYDDFCTALRLAAHSAMLLVDSETSITVPSPWAHLLHRDQWPTPGDARDDDCHLMVQCMESWFLADRNTLRAFYGQGYRANALPPVENPIELLDKQSVYHALAAATKDCKTKAPYAKGEHSFALLAQIDPAKVTAASKWAARFVTVLRAAMNC